MSIKSKVLSVAATLALVGGVGTAGVLGAGTASAATPSCGIACINLFSYQFGTHSSPNYTVDVLRQGEKVGQPIILFRTANYDPALDWTVVVPGHRGRLLRGRPGVVVAGAALRLHRRGQLPELPVQHRRVQLPLGRRIRTSWRSRTSTRRSAWTRACAWAWPRPRFSGEGVTLQPCGVSSKTVWVLDTLDQSFTAAWAHGYIPLINGSDTNFSQPFVLTYPASGVPTDKPRPQLFVTNLTGFSFHVGNLFGTGANSNQLWGATFGELK